MKVLDLDSKISNVVNQHFSFLNVLFTNIAKISPTANFIFEKIKSVADVEKRTCEAPYKLLRIIRKWENILHLDTFFSFSSS